MDTTEQEIAESAPIQADTTAEKRRTKRRHSLELKRQMVEESFQGTESVSVIARRYDVNANMLFRWRRLYEKGELGNESPKGTLFPVTLAQEVPALHAEDQNTQTDPVRGSIEITLPSGAQIAISGTVCEATLQSVIKAMTP